jgi:beta-phosphoglucomutase-like phosphatase (HAD superfamily)
MLLLTGQLEHLEFVITNEDVNNPKPDPEGYIKAMKRLDTIPVETLIVEDSEKGFQAARKSGARVFLANSVSSVKIDQLEKILKIFSNTKDFSLGGEIIDKNSKVKQVWSKK